MPRLVTFDVTNTLLRLRVSPGTHYAAVAAEHGLHLSAAEADCAFRRHFGALNVEWPNFGRGLAGGWRVWWSTLVERVVADAVVGPPPTAAAGAPLADRLLRDYAGAACWRAADGAAPLLASLRRRGRRLGVVSNFDPRLHVLLDQLRLREYFDFVIAAHEHPFCKPDGRIFELARRTAGDVEHCTHVGDSVEMDYRAARAAGWRALLVGGPYQEKDVDVAHVCPRLEDLEHYLD
ncbi:haloacid dehalogenase-like hydrolase domain-containing protein 3 [Pollicipes pollicipes]|uniref:haloacid dehalogenase-like hydrolase domain-containing protein 3 n=1 Tax=Pollicipes pollicipes TaxID=41117 RepID=UPI001884B758|nr:haloacid dehalogenase-like hydrolase domain-containing protein 3 [Pollicipes pollicipes]XP_037072338.1 haloacid dehalogenase-like hydrolase domain-containing protein 3 [Pollicipes pollicipes]